MSYNPGAGEYRRVPPTCPPNANMPLTKHLAPQRKRRSHLPCLESNLYSQQHPIISTLVSTDASPQCVPQCATHQAPGSTAHGPSKTQRPVKRKRQAENGESEVDLAIDADDGTSTSSGSGSGDASRPSWIGKMIEEPPGERGHGTNAHGRLGFNNDDILSQAGITRQKWGQYLVSNIGIPCRTLLLVCYSLLHTASLTAISVSLKVGPPTRRTTPMHGW